MTATRCDTKIFIEYLRYIMWVHAIHIERRISHHEVTLTEQLVMVVVEGVADANLPL